MNTIMKQNKKPKDNLHCRLIVYKFYFKNHILILQYAYKAVRVHYNYYYFSIIIFLHELLRELQVDNKHIKKIQVL